MGLMLLGPLKSGKGMGGRDAARANFSDNRYTIQPMLPFCVCQKQNCH